MRFLIDTCVISEWKRHRPDPVVLGWLDTLEQGDIVLSVLTVGEILKGIQRLPAGRRRDDLTAWLEQLRDMYAQQIFPVSFREVKAWAEISATAEQNGRPVAAIDGLLAATAESHGVIVATRNIQDFLATEVPLFNPWTTEWFNC